MDPMDTAMKMPEPEKEVSHLQIVMVLAFLGFVVFAVCLYIWLGMQNTPADNVPAVEVDTAVEEEVIDVDPADYTEAEKLEVLQNLDSNPDNLSRDDRREILNEL